MGGLLVKISFSRIKNVHFCPYQYKLFYIDNLKQPSGEPALFGQAIHNLFKDIVANNIDRKTAVGLWKKYYINEIANNDSDFIRIFPEKDFWLTKGYPVINVFFKKFEEFKIKKIISLEKRYKGEYKGHEVTLIADLIYENTSGSIVLADYKTGKEKETDYYQLYFYKDKVGVHIDECKIYYTFNGLKDFDTDDYKEKAEQYIDSGIQIIEKGEFLKNPTKNCKYCYFYKTGACDAKN